MDTNGQIRFAKDIIKNNIYLSLATTGVDPWVAPLFYCIDSQYNFYFVSKTDTNHAKHITNHPTVAFTIFDSHQEEGKGNGIQSKGKVSVVPDGEIPEALKWYHTTFMEMKPELLMGSSPYRIFKIVPEVFYILDPDIKEDSRIEVKLT